MSETPTKEQSTSMLKRLLTNPHSDESFAFAIGCLLALGLCMLMFVAYQMGRADGQVDRYVKERAERAKRYSHEQ